jgi:hypothetical protein
MRQLLFVLGLAALSVAASAHEIALKSLKVVHPWVYETEEQQAALHVKIRNTGDAPERLLRATTTIADGAFILDAQRPSPPGRANQKIDLGAADHPLSRQRIFSCPRVSGAGHPHPGL